MSKNSKNTHLRVSDAFPESAVLDGFVALSKLKAFGLSECGDDAVVELAIHNFESTIAFCIFTLVVVDVYVDEPLLLGTLAEDGA
jgi:hypothetical protein